MFFDELAAYAPSAVAIGDFDGVHIGHAAVIAQLADYASEHGYTPVALTFDVNTKQSEAIITPSQKTRLLYSCGAGAVITIDFDSLKNMPAADFASKLLSSGVKAVVCGQSFCFGKDKQGSAATLQSIGISVIQLPPVTVGGAPVSSTRIRLARELGDTDLVKELLGR